MNHGGFTPLLYAAREGCIECGKHLLKAKADINLPDPDGLTPLVLALTNMRFDFAAMLIEAGADVNKWDFWGRTPLYSAIDLNTLPRGGRPDLPSTDHHSGYDIAEMLLQKGADPNIQLKLRPPYRNGVLRSWRRPGDLDRCHAAARCSESGRREVSRAVVEVQGDRRPSEFRWRHAADGSGGCRPQLQPDSGPL